MTDDQLREELERRAWSADARDWVRGGLLPAVSAALVDRPVRVRPAGLSPAAASAAVLAVAAVVVAGVLIGPRYLVPPGNSPVAGSPSASSPAGLLECPIEVPPGDPREGSIQPQLRPAVADETGLVETCTLETHTEWGPVGASVATDPDDPRVLHVQWQGMPCDAAANLRLSDARLSQRPYDLLIEYPAYESCEAMGVVHSVSLELSQAVDAEHFDVRIVLPGSTAQQGIDWAPAEVGAFGLTLYSPSSTFVAGEPIEGIAAELAYVGDAAAVKLVGVGSLVNGFGIRQLDGQLSMGPAWDEPCAPETLAATIPRVVPFQKSGGSSADDPNAGFYRDFFVDPDLRLPAGTWRVTAYSEFAVGECGGPHVQLEASVVIEVRDA